GVMGQFIKWIPLVVNAALLFSLFDSFFLLPARIQFMGQTQQRSLSSWRDAWFTPLQKLFEGSLLWLMKHPWVTVGLFIVTFIGSFALTFLGNRFELFPKEGVEFYLGRIDLPLQSPLLKTQHEIKRISKEIIQLLGNDNIEAVIGRAGIQLAGIGDPLEKTEEHTGMIMVKIKADKAYSLNVQEVINTLNSKINKGAVEKMFFEAIGNGPPVGKPLNLVLKSSREDHLVTAIEEITMHLSKLVGIRNLATDQVSTGNEILIYPKMQNLNFVKLTEADLSSSLRAAYQGIVVTKFYENGEDFILRIRYDEPFRKSLKSFDFIKILNQRNQLIDLKYLVQTQERPASPVLRRYNFERSITLTAETDPTKLSAVTLNQKAAEYVESLKKRYPTLSAQFGGEAESTKESVESLVRALILALFGILAILVFAFNSFIKPLLVISSIPLGLVGVNLAFFLHQKPLSFLALIGVIGLAGVIVNSAIILVSAIDEKLSNNSVTQLPLDQRVKIVVDVSTERLKPILITSLTTVAGLFPTAYGMGGYDATLVPLTLAMGWGLFVGTFLSLVWIPTLYRVLFLRRPHRITK
ncbi:MAG: efflux RND transporter permease subunit, partial [Bdellovibrionaceae bacterium]|nr:efflux RND transporter permease subunit [Pseudobdellovibrionaceae bacterium]